MTIDKLNKLLGSVGVALVAALPFLLFLGGLVALVVAFYLINTVVGTIALGLVLLLIGYVVSPDEKGGKK